MYKVYFSSATVTSLQAKVESLTTTNALMKEDLSITRISNDKIQVDMPLRNNEGNPIFKG